MRPFESILFSSALLFIFPACNLAGAQQTAAAAQPSATANFRSVILSAGTKVELLVTRPVWTLTAKAGDAIYAQTSFPVVLGMGIAIPAGTYVQGTIESVTRPARRTNHAEIDVRFTKFIFANGYVVPLPGDPATAATTPGASPQSEDAETLIAITIQVTTTNDLLLDNGADVEMTLAAPLALDAEQITQAIPLSRLPQPGQFKSATQCRFIPGSPGSPGTPGTPDTVIPGTPSTTIPGGPGMPDTVIPGTSDTVIPGSPGTPGSSGTPDYICPPAPMVISCAPVVKNKQPLNSQPAAAR
ncbi:MAG: hypothetical protein P4K93_11485 [Terracidiphilus sp.]|nr:hypothetical protein [Terracidiphilus sp.]